MCTNISLCSYITFIDNLLCTIVYFQAQALVAKACTTMEFLTVLGRYYALKVYGVFTKDGLRRYFALDHIPYSAYQCGIKQGDFISIYKIDLTTLKNCSIV